MLKRIKLILLSFICATSFVFATEFRVQPSKSTVAFTACCHAFIYDVEGIFEEFTGLVDFDEKENKILSITAEIAVDSVNTKIKKRDQHLRSPDFFDALSYPKISFKSTSIEKIGDEIVVMGVLSMRGSAKTITLKGQMIAITENSLQLQASGEINAKDFGIGDDKIKDLVVLKIDAFFKK